MICSRTNKGTGDDQGTGSVLLGHRLRSYLAYPVGQRDLTQAVSEPLGGDCWADSWRLMKSRALGKTMDDVFGKDRVDNRK